MYSKSHPLPCRGISVLQNRLKWVNLLHSIFELFDSILFLDFINQKCESSKEHESVSLGVRSSGEILVFKYDFYVI